MNDPEREPGRDAGRDPAGGEPATLPPTLEGRLKRLEQILVALEADELELERALELFEEGVAHVRAAERVLSETELRVEELLDADGNTRAFEGEGGG